MPRIAALSNSAAALVGAAIGLQLLSASMPPARAADKPANGSSSKKTKPLFRDFMGLNVHSVAFKPEIYKPVCRLLRDYHPLDWDLGDDTSSTPPFPLARNQVSWDHEYGTWKSDGYDVDACIQFESIPEKKWKNLGEDFYNYSRTFARFFGPSSTRASVSSVEIGNEPGKYSDAAYRTLFEKGARGLREGDPKLKIATCNMVVGKADDYSQSFSCIKGLESLYDVINVHSYAFAEHWPTWRHSYPEDPTIDYLKPVTNAIQWRDENAPGKEVWLTEFGWDSSTKPPPATGDAAKWVGNTDMQQAQYIVRSFLVLSGMDVDRAYIFYYDDDDAPTLFGASGLTRHFTPKPSFHAVTHLYKTLGDCRFERIVPTGDTGVDVYEYRSAKDPGSAIWAVWSPTGANKEVEAVLPSPGGKVIRSEVMPLAEGSAKAAPWQALKDGKIKVTATETPAYFWIQRK